MRKRQAVIASEAKQSRVLARFWIASSRSLSSGAHSRDPLAPRNDGGGGSVSELPIPTPRLTVITLGVSNMRASIAFYEALGFSRRMRGSGETVAFFDTGATV